MNLLAVAAWHASDVWLADTRYVTLGDVRHPRQILKSPGKR